MRITIETTVSELQYQKKAIIEVPFDDVGIQDAFEMFADALEGFGYSGAKKYLEGDDGI